VGPEGESRSTKKEIEGNSCHAQEIVGLTNSTITRKEDKRGPGKVRVLWVAGERKKGINRN